MRILVADLALFRGFVAIQAVSMAVLCVAGAILEAGGIIPQHARMILSHAKSIRDDAGMILPCGEMIPGCAGMIRCLAGMVWRCGEMIQARDGMVLPHAGMKQEDGRIIRDDGGIVLPECGIALADGGMELPTTLHLRGVRCRGECGLGVLPARPMQKEFRVHSPPLVISSPHAPDIFISVRQLDACATPPRHHVIRPRQSRRRRLARQSPAGAAVENPGHAD
jgi:hypothetical protein